MLIGSHSVPNEDFDGRVKAFLVDVQDKSCNLVTPCVIQILVVQSCASKSLHAASKQVKQVKRANPIDMLPTLFQDKLGNEALDDCFENLHEWLIKKVISLECEIES